MVIAAGAAFSQTDATRPADSTAMEDYEFVIDNSTLAMGAADFQAKFTEMIIQAIEAANQDTRLQIRYILPLVNVTHTTDIVGSGYSGTDANAFHNWLLANNCDTTNFWIFQTQNGSYAAGTPTYGPGPDGFIFTVSSQSYTNPLMVSHEVKGHGTGSLLTTHVNGRMNMTYLVDWGGWITFSDGKTIGASSTGGHYLYTYTIPVAYNANSTANGGDGYFHFEYSETQPFPSKVAVSECHNDVGETDVSTGINNYYDNHPDRIRHEAVTKPAIPQITATGGSVSISNPGDYGVLYATTTDPNFSTLNATPEKYEMYLYSAADTTDGNFIQGPIAVNSSFNNLAEGTYYVRIYAVFGNSLSFTSQSASIDVTPPSSTMSGLEATNVSPVIITQEFSEPIDQSTLTASDYNVNDGTVTGIVFINDSTVEITVDPTTGFVGDIDVTLPANSCNDLNGNGNTSASFGFYFDAEQPDPDLDSSEPGVTNATSFAAELTFPNEPNGVTGVEAGDFWTYNCTVSDIQGAGSDYTFTVTPTNEGEVQARYSADMALDPANNSNIESGELSRSVDWTSPDVNIHDNNPEIIGGGTYTAYIDFTEPVNGFTMSDIGAVNATKSNFQILNDSSYTVDYTPIASGAVSLSVGNDKCEDEATNPNNASNLLEKTANLDFPYSNMSSTAPYYSNADTIDVEIPFNKPVFGLGFDDLTFNNAVGAEFTQVNDSTWTVKAIPQEDGSFSIDLPAGACVDEFDNPSLADLFERINDQTQPNPIITGEPNEDGTFTLTFDFGELVTDFDSTDVTVTNGATLSGFEGEGAIYTGIITPGAASCQVLIDENVCEDLALNPNLASNPYQIVIDGVLTHYNELKNFKIYPNPANDIVNIETDGDIRSIEVYNSMGQLVILHANAYSEDKAQLDVSKLIPGLYIVHVDNGNSALRILIIE